jgi:hypothetical protein
VRAVDPLKSNTEILSHDAVGATRRARPLLIVLTNSEFSSKRFGVPEFAI